MCLFAIICKPKMSFLTACDKVMVAVLEWRK